MFPLLQVQTLNGKYFPSEQKKMPMNNVFGSFFYGKYYLPSRLGRLSLARILKFLRNVHWLCRSFLKIYDVVKLLLKKYSQLFSDTNRMFY